MVTYPNPACHGAIIVMSYCTSRNFHVIFNFFIFTSVILSAKFKLPAKYFIPLKIVRLIKKSPKYKFQQQF